MTKQNRHKRAAAARAGGGGYSQMVVLSQPSKYHKNPTLTNRWQGYARSHYLAIIHFNYHPVSDGDLWLE